MEYIKVQEITSPIQILFNSVEEYLKSIKDLSKHIVYIENGPIDPKRYNQEELNFLNKNGVNANSISSSFVVLRNSTAYKLKSNGFGNILEYQDAVKKGFLFSSVLIKANEMGFDEYSSYRTCIELGYKSKSDYDLANSKGFGSTRSSDFYLSEERGFDSAEEFAKANKLGIASKQVLEIYDNYSSKLEELNLDSYDAVFLYRMLNGLPPGKMLSKQRLYASFIQTQRQQFNGSFPNWFTRKLTSEAALIAFLESNTSILKIGSYDSDGEVFNKTQQSQLIREKAILDGSNIAWANGSKSKGDLPKLANLILMIDELQAMKFEEIVCVVDASLKHQIDDPDGLEELISKKNIHEAPAKSDADRFIIEYLKKNPSYLVTNDTFRKDYFYSDPWVKQHIDEYRVTFMIIDNSISFGKDLMK